jgi:hypothetical protein
MAGVLFVEPRSIQGRAINYKAPIWTLVSDWQARLLWVCQPGRALQRKAMCFGFLLPLVTQHKRAVFIGCSFGIHIGLNEFARTNCVRDCCPIACKTLVRWLRPTGPARPDASASAPALCPASTCCRPGRGKCPRDSGATDVAAFHRSADGRCRPHPKPIGQSMPSFWASVAAVEARRAAGKPGSKPRHRPLYPALRRSRATEA